MRPTLHHPVRFVLFGILVLGLTCPVAGAQEPPLGEIELPSRAIVVDLDDAAVQIVAAAGEQPMLRWWRARTDDPRIAELDAFENEAGVVIARPSSEQDDATGIARLRIEIATDSLQGLSVNGSDLNLEIRRVQPEPEITMDSDAPAQDPGPAPPIGLELAASTISLREVGSVSAVLDGCDTDLLDTTGNQELTVVSGQLRSVGHQGEIFVRGENADISAERSRGRTKVIATGGSVNLRTVNGRFDIRVNDGGLQILGGAGSGAIFATHSSGDIRNTRFKSLNVKGAMSHITVSDVNGSQTVDLTGGSLTADDCVGDIQGSGRDGAELRINGHEGNLVLNIQEDASTDIRDVNGDVKLTGRGADLTVDRVSSLALDATESRVTASGISKLASFQSTRSEIDLDLSECGDRKVTLAVQAESRVHLTLRTPCQVHATGVGSALASQIDVVGCELQLGSGGRWATRRSRGIDGSKPITVTANVAKSAELTVEGR